MQSLEDAVEVPYCCVCRRSSDLKWRKHIFSKSHQRAAVDFLAVRVASFEVTKAEIATQSGTHNTLHCIFCKADIESLRHWVKHFASATHRKRLNNFCKHHRCDAAQQTRQQLCLAADDADSLIQALDDHERQREAAMKDAEARAAPSAFASSCHIETFMNTVAARLQDVRSSRQQTTQVPRVASSTTKAAHYQVHQVVDHAVMKSAHRTIEAARGSGLGSIRRVDWGEQVANVHSAATPPWMVDTEEEYKRCNQRSSRSAPGKGAKRKQPSSGHSEEEAGSDIFARLKPTYDEATWLPNFGGVWQEGPRSKTRKDFSKVPALRAPRREEPQPIVSREVRIPPPPKHQLVTASALAQPEELSHEAKNSIQAVSSHLVAPPPVSSVLDAKKSLLLAQKERLRAKLAAKRTGDNR